MQFPALPVLPIVENHAPNLRGRLRLAILAPEQERGEADPKSNLSRAGRTPDR